MLSPGDRLPMIAYQSISSRLRCYRFLPIRPSCSYPDDIA